MKKKLTKHGNSFALIIDAPILALLKIEVSDLIELTTDGVCLFISKAVSNEVQNKTRENK